MMSRMLIRGAHVVDPSQGIDGILDIELDQGRIVRLGQGLTAEGVEVIDAQGLYAMPGPVSYTHLDVYKRQIPDGIQGVHFQLIIAVRAVLRRQEHFKIVILKDHLVPLGNRSPNGVLLKIGTDIECLVIPEQLGLHQLGWSRTAVTFDIVKGAGPGLSLIHI